MAWRGPPSQKGSASENASDFLKHVMHADLRKELRRPRTAMTDGTKDGRFCLRESLKGRSARSRICLISDAPECRLPFSVFEGKFAVAPVDLGFCDVPRVT